MTTHLSHPDPTTPATPQAHAKMKRTSWDGRGEPSGLRLTHGDFLVIDTLTRYGVASHEMLQRHAYKDVTRTTTRRLSYLHDLGLITSSREREHVHGRLYGATTRATRMAHEQNWTHTNLSPYVVPTSGDLTHRLALTDVGLGYQSRGHLVVTEREIRAAERAMTADVSIALARELGIKMPAKTSSSQRRHYVAIPTPKGLHYPDMIVKGSDGAFAVEVELTAKEDARVMRTLTAYAQAGQLAGCIWLVSGKAREQLVGPRLNAHRRKVPGLLHERPGHHAQDLQVADQGVQYALDKRELGRAGAHLTSKSDWRLERVRWQEDARGKSAGVGFQAWVLARSSAK